MSKIRDVLYPKFLEFMSCMYLQNCFISIAPQSSQYMQSYEEDSDKDSFIGPQEFVVGYSKAPEQH